jgi:hypothetical protein
MSIATRRAALSAALVLSGALVGCGSGGAGDVYSLRIEPPQSLTTTQTSMLLHGEGFVPAGSTCPGGCKGLLPPPVFGDLGPHTMAWSNAATGEGGPIWLRWICNCGGSAPLWMVSVPLAPGPNPITVTETDRWQSQQASITITRN